MGRRPHNRLPAAARAIVYALSALAVLALQIAIAAQSAAGWI